MRFVPAVLHQAFRGRRQSSSPAAASNAAARSWQANPTRQIAAGGVLIVAVVVATAWLLLTNLRNEQIARTERELESMTLVLTEQVDRNLQSIELIQDSVIERVLTRGVVTAGDFEREMSAPSTYRFLREQIGAQPYIDAILITNAASKPINSTRSWLALTTPNNSYALDTFRGNTNSIDFVGRPIRNPEDGYWVFPFTRRIIASSGEHLGAVTALIRADYFEDYFKTVSRSRDRSIALFKSDGMQVARFPADEARLRVSFANRTIFTNILAHKNFGTVQQESRDDRRMLLISGRNLPRYPMAIVVTSNIDDVLMSWRYAALYVGGVAIVIALTIGCVVVFVIRQIRRNLEAQNRRLDAALNNMPHGLTMFDASARLIVCNDRYQEMYKLPDEAVRTGTTLIELLRYRAASGTNFKNYQESPDGYLGNMLKRVATGKAYSYTNEIADGRTILISHQPTPDGGWVTTHEDITEARRRESSFRLLFDGNPVPMWVYDVESLRIIAVNDAAVEHYGYTRERFMAMTALDIRPIEDRAAMIENLQNPERPAFGQHLRRHLKADGSIIDVLSCFRAMNYEGRRASLVAIQDITARKAAEDQLRSTQSFLDGIIENVPVPIFVKEIDSGNAEEWRYTLINRATEELLGISRDYVIGKTPVELFPQTQAGYIIDLNTDTLLSGEPVFRPDHPIDTFLNGRRLVTSRSAAIRDHRQQPLYVLTVLEDVTERRRVEQGIARMAHHDTLTDLPNRMAFNDAIQAAIETASKTGNAFVLLSLDLDGFKEANDTYGHAVGDTLLREIARRLQTAAGNAFVARIGGDEFTIIVSGGPQPEAAVAVAERLIACVRNDINIDDLKINIGATIGGAAYPTHGTDAKTLLINADVALYRAKAAARGSVVFYEASMGEQQRERRALQDELRIAVQNDELLLHYQPQFTMSGAAVGFEALVRWQSPKRGLVSPAQFIPLAEESGLIVPLGDLVLRQACREAVTWHVPLTVAVNVSPVQFRAGDLAERVQSVLMETGLAPARLELEITENVLIDDFSRAISILCRLKALGVRIALDDFGSGYSSLSYLHSFSFDKIKIDRTFIGDLESNRHSKAIVRAVIDLGHSLSVPILAEGVETPAQHALLERNGCDEVQGYLTGRPAPIAQHRNLTDSRETQPQGYAAAI